jgi:ketosteroid isomerase-like protein
VVLEKEEAMNPIATAPPEDATVLSPMDRTAIDTYLTRMEHLEKTNDWRSLSELMAPGCVTMPPRRATKEGRRAWLQWIEEMDFRVHEFSLIPQEFDGCGDFAFVRCNYRWSYSLEGREKPVEDSGKFLGVLRKQADGKWLASHWMWNSDAKRT